jgi:transcriptional regulator with XRE-family HTH domain
MRGMTNTLTLGERIAWYRRRRGMSQDVLAGLIGRTVDWLSKIENNRIELDRVSVIRLLADTLDVSLGDLLNEPSLMEWTADSGRRTIPAVRAALMDYRQVLQLVDRHSEPAPMHEIELHLDDLWNAYQASRFGYVTNRVPALLAETQVAANGLSGDEQLRAFALLALTYQAAATTLTKVGESDLSWIASDRGLVAAQRSGDPAVIGSLFRSVTHSLLSTGRFSEAVKLSQDAAEILQPDMKKPSPKMLSVYGALTLGGAMAAARAEDRQTARDFLEEAEVTARRLGRDANHLWTAFGPTNVAIHRVSTAMELGDVQVALNLAPAVDTVGMPTERRVRHSLEVARMYSRRNRRDEAVATLLDAETIAPEQVRYHFLSRHLVQTWIRQQRGKPSPQLTGLAERLRVA